MALPAGRPLIAAVACAVALAGCGEAPRPIALVDLDGASHRPAEVPADFVHVVVFTSHECPIANAYAPTLSRLHESWRGAPVRLFVVHVDPDLGVEAARAHRDDYGLPGTVLLDPRQQLAAALGATITPEAVVLDGGGVVYRGRIDDQWRGLGTRSPAAARHDLRDAVAAALRGEPVPTPHPAAVGCLLPEPRRD